MFRLPKLPLLLALPLLLLGCQSPTHQVEDPYDQGIIDADHLGIREVRVGVNGLLKRVSAKYAQGWPPHILKSKYTGLPLVRISGIRIDSRSRFNRVALKNELLNALNEQGIVEVAASKEDLAAVNQERDYSSQDAGMTHSEAEYGKEDPVSLVLRGEITDDVIEQGGKRQHDYFFHLRLIDTVRAVRVVTTSTPIRKSRQRASVGG